MASIWPNSGARFGRLNSREPNWPQGELPKEQMENERKEGKTMEKPFRANESAEISTFAAFFGLELPYGWGCPVRGPAPRGLQSWKV